MGSWNRLLTSCAAVLFLGLVAGAAQATSTGGCSGSCSWYDPFELGEVLSGNETLLFSNFLFHSPSCSVDPDDLTITILDDGIEISGPITPSAHGWAKFYVSYEVTAVNSGEFIDGASLELESSVYPPPGVVFATKRVIGERPDKPVGHPWHDHGWGHLGWGLLHAHRGHGYPDGKTLAFLKTAEWDVDGGCLCDLGWEWCEGEFPFDEESFDPQESVKVIDGVWIKARRGGEAEFVWSSNRYSVIPEPATAALLAFGLLGLAIGRHRL